MVSKEILKYVNAKRKPDLLYQTLAPGHIPGRQHFYLKAKRNQQELEFSLRLTQQTRLYPTMNEVAKRN